MIEGIKDKCRLALRVIADWGQAMDSRPVEYFDDRIRRLELELVELKGTVPREHPTK